MNQRKKWLVPAIIGGVVLLLCIWCFSSYNGLVGKEETVAEQWGNVQAQYQRRADLIPNLINTVKGYARHEKSTFEELTAARAKATSINLDAENLTPEQLQKFQGAQGVLSVALGKLLAIKEAYPDLKASQNFADLQAQLEGTENRIRKSRSDYNEAVKKYNTSVRSFPANIVASMFGFERKAPFEAEQGSEKAPSVSFE